MMDDCQAHRGAFRVDGLKVVGDAGPPDNPPLSIGDWCRLASGGPDMLVVDDLGAHVVASWLDGGGEAYRVAALAERVQWLSTQDVSCAAADGVDQLGLA